MRWHLSDLWIDRFDLLNDNVINWLIHLVIGCCLINERHRYVFDIIFVIAFRVHLLILALVYMSVVSFVV